MVIYQTHTLQSLEWLQRYVVPQARFEHYTSSLLEGLAGKDSSYRSGQTFRMLPKYAAQVFPTTLN
jgi:hypothetical protein